MLSYPAGSEVATAAYRISGPLLSRLVPPWRPIRVVPEGMCSWGDLWKVSLLNGAAWQLPVAFHLVPGHSLIARRAGEAAQANDLRCPAMEAATGLMVWIPAAAWRTTHLYGNVALPPERAAIKGWPLRISGDPNIMVEPLLLLHDLALLLGAANPPPLPPRRVLDAIAELGAGWRSRRCDQDNDLTPPIPDKRETTSEAAVDLLRQKDDASAVGQDHAEPFSLGFRDTAVHLQSGSVPSGPVACGTQRGEVRHAATAPRLHDSSAGLGRVPHRESATNADDSSYSGCPTAFVLEADATSVDESGIQNPSANQSEISAAACGRLGAAKDRDSCNNGAATVTEGRPATETSSSPMAFGTGSDAAGKARAGRKTGSSPLADHLLFPKAQELLVEGRHFETVTGLCGYLAKWLQEEHGMTMQPGSIEGALRKRSKSLLDEICPPTTCPTGTLPNGRPRASGTIARD